VISRQHARLEAVAGGFQLNVSPGNTNPTFLEGKIVTGRAAAYERYFSRWQPGSWAAGHFYIPCSECSRNTSRAGRTDGKHARLQLGRDIENDVKLDAPSSLVSMPS